MGQGTLTPLPRSGGRTALLGWAQKSCDSSVTPKGSQGAAPLPITASAVPPSCRGLVPVTTWLTFHLREESLPSLGNASECKRRDFGTCVVAVL